MSQKWALGKLKPLDGAEIISKKIIRKLIVNRKKLRKKGITLEFVVLRLSKYKCSMSECELDGYTNWVALKYCMDMSSGTYAKNLEL